MARKKRAGSTAEKTASPKRASSPGKKPPSAKKAAGKPKANPETAVKRTKAPANGKSVKTAPKKPEGLPIVGIGASAGGLDAFQEFFKAMPADSGMAFVLVAHLDPTHVSILPELLQKRTEMPVHQITDGVKIRPNSVYVIPPNKALSILNGTLQLMELAQPRGANLPIDSFFRSLAQDQGANAACIVLSGTGTDGTLGVKAIKGDLGMVMVQDEESAKYDGMPRSAIATGLADYVLPPDQMPEQLIKYMMHASRKPTSRIVPVQGQIPNVLQKVFVILRARTSHDFSLYKKNTICRRIERRMNVHQIDDINDYVRYLQESDREAEILFKELLIGVTGFFRDPEAFDVLKTKALSKLLADKVPDSTVRVWVPGCSSGEEAYSIAILLHECREKLTEHFNIQIFGIDIDEEAIQIARAGVYPASILADLGPDRLKRHFIKQDDGQYRVRKVIREMLVFAPQNIIKDPPFTKLDILSCRNLLIYLGPELQKKLLPNFHYSLVPGGILMLGSSETIGHDTDLFATISTKWKVFRRKPTSSIIHATTGFPSNLAAHDADRPAGQDVVRDTEKISVLQLVESILQQSDTPPCAVINDAGDLVYIHGRTGKFLEPAQGKASMNILQMARPGLKTELTAAIRNVASHKQDVVVKDVCVSYNGSKAFIDLSVKPILEQSALRGLMMVVFQEVQPPARGAKRTPRRTSPRKTTRTAEELAQELQHTREDLQTTIEELETSNEELKSTNEELQSTNEELQSTNEELETSKEELQSLNEESATVNAELQSRLQELAQNNDDMKNLLDSTSIATVFLDLELQIRRFTPSMIDIIPLAATDIGRPVRHFAANLIDLDLPAIAEKVLKDLQSREMDVASKDDRWFTARVRPYRTVTNVIDGVVVTFDDITERKRQSDEKLKLLAAVIMDSNDALMVQDRDGRILAWNKGAEKMYGYSAAEALDMNIDELVPPDKKTEALQLVKSLFKGKLIESFQTQRLTKDDRVLSVWLTVTLLRDSEGEPCQVATTERDITHWNPGKQTCRHIKPRARA